MVAYSFKKRFADKVVAREKRQTIRAHRKGSRHARPGERMQLYFGMRTKHCRKLIDDPVCESVTPIDITVPSAGLATYRMEPDDEFEEIDDDFARADGFDCAADFTAFWQQEHGLGLFSGVLIKWRDA